MRVAIWPYICAKPGNPRLRLTLSLRFLSKIVILEKPQFGPAVSDLLAIDIPDVLQISEECGLCMWSFDAYAAEIERDDSIMIKLSDDNRKAIGFAVGRVFSVGIRKFTVELTNIGLRKDFRNRGYGSM